MPVIKTNFELKSDDIDRLNQAIAKLSNKEYHINETLEKVVAPKITKSVTDFLPIAEVKHGPHAKDSKWYELEYYNLSFVLSNSLKGKNITMANNKNSQKSFYYLYFPATGLGNNHKKGVTFPMDKGVDVVYDDTVNDLINSLIKDMEEEISNV